MATFKNIRIKKRGGGTRLQRVQVLASGKYRFVKNISISKKAISKRSSPSKSTKKRTKSRGNVKVANKNRAMTIRLGAAGGVIGALSIPDSAGQSILSRSVSVLFEGGSPQGLVKTLSERMGVVGGKFDLRELLKTITPLVVGSGISVLASKFGINRKLGQAQAGLPVHILV